MWAPCTVASGPVEVLDQGCLWGPCLDTWFYCSQASLWFVMLPKITRKFMIQLMKKNKEAILSVISMIEIHNWERGSWKASMRPLPPKYTRKWQPTKNLNAWEKDAEVYVLTTDRSWQGFRWRRTQFSLGAGHWEFDSAHYMYMDNTNRTIFFEVLGSECDQGIDKKFPKNQWI